MDARPVDAASAGGDATAPDPRRWKALAVLGLMQFMFVIDATVVNVALPSIQSDLGFSRSGLAWVVNGYVVMAAGLLLLGGRLADIVGRRRLFLFGVILFGVTSVTSGVAVNPGMLVASRFFQGIGEAMGVPSALGLVFVLFTAPNERTKAVGMWGGISGLAGTLGVVISGLLTDFASWRWIFYINVPLVIFALIMVPRLVSESRMVRTERRFDFPGAVTVTAGLVAIVFGLLQAADRPWGSVRVAVPLVIGLVLLALTVVIEARTAVPLIPLRFFGDRTRAVSYLTILFAGCSFFTFVYLLTLFQQQVLGFSPLRSGLFYLPIGLLIGVGVGLTTGLMAKVGAKPLVVVGLLGAAGGLLLVSGIHPGISYAGGILPGMILFGVGFGALTAATANTALHRVTGQDSSLASAVLNTMQQIGGALGLAGAATIALRYAAHKAAGGVGTNVAATDGYALAFRCAAGMLAVGAVLVLLFLKNIKPKPGTMPGAGLDPESGEVAEVPPAVPAGEASA